MFITFGAIGGGIVRTQFFPFIERDNLDISLDMPAGTNEAITQQWIDHIEATVWKVNDQYKAERADGLDVVTAVQKNIGPSTSKARLNVILLDSETRLTPSFLIQNDIRKATGEIPGADNLSFGGAQAFGKPISVSLVSYDLEALRAAKEILKSKLKGMDALTDVVDNDQKGIREITLHLTDKARYLGLTPGSIMTQVRENFFGAQVQRLQRGEDEVKVWVRLDEKDRRELWDLEELLITTAQGEVPLRELATYTIERGTVNINHLDGQREFRVERICRAQTVRSRHCFRKFRRIFFQKFSRTSSGLRALRRAAKAERENTREFQNGHADHPVLDHLDHYVHVPFLDSNHHDYAAHPAQFDWCGLGTLVARHADVHPQLPWGGGVDRDHRERLVGFGE